jgi:hypothetical protein
MSERFVSQPNLPEGRVTALILGAAGARLVPALAQRGIKTYVLPPNGDIAAPVAGHADMSLFYFGGGEALAAKGIARGIAPSAAFDLKISACSAPQTAAYPGDVSLNALQIGNLIFARRDSLAPEITAHAEKSELEIINVAQGYARCSACVVDKAHIITADAAIAQAAETRGIRALKISPGYFRLPGYDAGFIGGAAFKLSPAELAFTGRIDAHPDAEAIYAYLAQCGVKPVFLTDEPCFDIGGAVLIKNTA